MRAHRMLLLAVAASLAACGADPAGRAAVRSGDLALDLRPLFGARRQIPGTVIDSLALDVTQQGSAVAPGLGRKLLRGESVVSLPVTVPEGRTRFEARVLSTNGTVLMEGSAEAEVREDGFRVEVRLVPLTPLLVVRPDSVLLRIGAADTSVVVENRGIGTLVWSISETDPPLETCGRLPCLFVQPTAGRLAAGDSEVISLYAPVAPQSILLTFSSAEGEVALRVRVTQ